MKFKTLFIMAYKEKYQYTKGAITFIKYGKQICNILTEFEQSREKEFKNFNGIEDLNKDIYLKLIKKFQECNNKPSTIERKLNVLRGILTFAQKNKLIEQKNRIPYVLNDNKGLPIYFSDEEKEKFLNYFKTDFKKYLKKINFKTFPKEYKLKYGRILTKEQLINKIKVYKKYYKNALLEHRKMYLYSILAFKTGMRISNIIHLNEKNFINGDIVIEECDTKNGEPFVMPMTDEIIKTVDELRELNFFEGWNDQQVRYRFKKAVDILGLKSSYTPHKARHTFITKLSEEGAPDDLGRQLSGHKSSEMYQRYNHYSKRKEKLRFLSQL